MRKLIRLYHQFLPIYFSIIVALLAVYVGDVAQLPVLALLATLTVWAVRTPAVGLLAGLPLVFMIHPTPNPLSWREFSFIAVIGTGGIAALWQARAIFFQKVIDERWTVLAIISLLLTNITTAYRHEVSLSDWWRGVAPFIFILYLVPVWLETHRNPKFATAWSLAACATAALFAWHVLYVYISEELWKPYTYFFENGQWVRIGAGEAPAIGEKVFEFALRITQRVQQSTDVMLPLGVVWGVWGALWAHSRVTRMGALSLATLATVAVVLTYTRSMLLTAVLVVGALLALAFKWGQYLRAVTVAGVLTTAAISTAFCFDLESIYLNRLYQTTRYIESVIPENDQGPVVKKSQPLHTIDTNISARFNEYQIALKMFKASPFFGQGLGVRHAMNFDTGQGEILKDRVSYIHNWVAYMLMVGGVAGLAAYSFLLFRPAMRVTRLKNVSKEQKALMTATIVTMTIYALFFAVFRLIPFNLVLGGLWGLTLTLRRREEEEGG